MTISVVPLGTNGALPSLGRHTMSFLVLAPKEALLLDAGTGVARFLEPSIAALLAPYDRLNVILSHYHLDHTTGLSYLPLTWTGNSIKLYAPSRPFTESAPEEALDRLLSPPLYSPKLADFPFDVEIIPIANDSLQIGDLTIALRAQKHPGGSMGIRIGDAVAYVTDTVVDEATAGFVARVSLLMHELWLTDAEAEQDEPDSARHSFVSGLARIAKAAAVGTLMPVHHRPKRTYDEVCQMAREVEDLAGVQVMVPTEGEIYPVN
jgi:ribonuclease BN (tRNA processing enzyme)